MRSLIITLIIILSCLLFTINKASDSEAQGEIRVLAEAKL